MSVLNSTARAALEEKDAVPNVPIERLNLKLHGDPARPVTLNTTLVLPSGSGPFPLVVFNHGSNGEPKKNDMRNYDRHMATYYFLSRGYAVALPLLRGHGGSGGSLTHQGGCDLDKTALDNAKDILSVVDQLAKNPRIDASRVVMAGGSFGGWNSLAVGTLNDPRVKIIVNFYGGVRATNCKMGDEALRRGARNFGKSSRTPSIWFYGDNDHLFPKPLWEAMHRAYVEAGGSAQMVAYGTFKSDSHRLMSDPSAIGIVASRLDTFLARNDFPALISHPQYVPLVPPPVSHFAAIDDVDALPFVNAKNRDAYLTFLKAPRPRAFFIADGRGTIATDGGYDPLARGYATCQQHGVACRLYAFNDDVVWTYPTPPPPATQFAGYEDSDAIPYLNSEGRAGYAGFRTLPRPKAFVIAPNGAWMVVSGEMNAVGAALERCRRIHPACEPYAVDGNVVWRQQPSAIH